MQAEGTSPALREYLRLVRSHLPLRTGPDILRELESSILDRVDALAAEERRAPDEDLVARAIREVGEPEKVAGAYVRERYLVGPEAFRPFLLVTCLVFALHLVLIGVATTIDRPIHTGVYEVAPIGHRGFLSLAASAVHALLLDVGLMALVFSAAPFAQRALAWLPAPVEASPRQAGARAALATLVAVGLNSFRDHVFVVVAGRTTYPLFTEWFTAVLPLVTAVLALAVVSDVLYAVFGERRSTLAADALHGVLGVACMLHILRGDPILQIPAIEAFESFHEPLNSFLSELGNLVLVTIAFLLATKTVRRLVRFAQI